MKRHGAVMPFSTVASDFMRKHWGYWWLVPEAARGRALIPSPYDRAQEVAVTTWRVTWMIKHSPLNTIESCATLTEEDTRTGSS